MFLKVMKINEVKTDFVVYIFGTFDDLELFFLKTELKSHCSE